MESLRGKAAIVGAAEADLGEKTAWSPAGLMAQAAKRAMEESGVRKDEIDGVFSASSYYYMPTLTLCEYLGLRPRYLDSTVVGGCSFEYHLNHAVGAIAAGLCEVALIAYGSTQRSDQGRLVTMNEQIPYEQTYGVLHPVTPYALIATRHMAQYGTTSEQLAEIATSTRAWGVLNPKAMHREPITVEDVLRSPMISSPLHRLDCCVVTDGGGAVIVTSAERARDYRKRPIYVWGAGEATTHKNITYVPDMTITGGAQSGPAAFRMAGIGPGDVDFAQLYDAFTITPLLALEDLGFCPKGEGGRFVEGGRIAPGGSLPVNTNGGGLSYCHPGMYGIFLLIEAVAQLRGECGARQVLDSEIGVVHGIGGVLSATATAVLSNLAS